MIFLLLFMSLISWAGQPSHWSHLLQVTEKHEFYEANQDILKPKDSWQHLFSAVYIDRNLNRLKDCVFFKVPGADLGILKFKTISTLESCEEFLLKPGDQEFTEIKSLQFSITDKDLKIDLTFKDFRNEKWEAHFQSSFNRPQPILNLSSAEFKAPKVILLAPKSKMSSSKVSLIKNNTLCHDIKDDCSETSISRCDQCSEGWYEIPNGCDRGPKYCGVLNCGKKGQPACRRGMKWQRPESPFDCRTDSSFAYCANGIKVSCEGNKAFCR